MHIAMLTATGTPHTSSGVVATSQPDVTSFQSVEDPVTPTPPQHAMEDDVTPPQHPAEDAAMGGGAEEGGVQVQGAWHQLASYIVHLEKRVREIDQARHTGEHMAWL